MTGLADLAEDILIRIASFLSPPDVIRLRQVSKTLYSATYQPVLWIRAYRNAALPRPPGPYLRPGDAEGLNSLERALVQSTECEPWSARSFHLDDVRTVSRVGDYTNRWHFPQLGSWFITTVDSSVVYRNLNSDDPQTHVLFRLDDASNGINVFNCADTVTLEGHPITYVLLKPWSSAYPLTLLKIVGHFRSSLSLEAAIPLSYPLHPEVHHMTASPRYVCLYTSGVPEDGEFRFALLDVTTEKIYFLPPFMSTVEPETLARLTRNYYNLRHAEFVLTDTHILAAFMTEDPDHHIQAFRLPSEVESGTAADDGMLRMTHEGICKIFGSPEWVLRANTVTDVGGETTEIRLMTHHREGDPMSQTSFGYIYTAIDLTLSPSSSPGIGTITLSQRTPLISLKNEWARFFKMASSQDGFGRGVCCINNHIQTFSVDASGPVCRVDLGIRRDVSKLDPLEHLMQFEPWSGRICYTTMDSIRIHKFV